MEQRTTLAKVFHYYAVRSMRIASRFFKFFKKKRKRGTNWRGIQGLAFGHSLWATESAATGFLDRFDAAELRCDRGQGANIDAERLEACRMIWGSAIH